MSLKKICIFFLSVVSLFFCLRGVYFCYNKFGNFNKIIFPRAYEERDFKEEYKNNFFVENQYLYYIDTLNKKLEFAEKMDYEEYKNEAFVNKIPCILLSFENQETKSKKNNKKRELVVYFGGNGETIYYSFAYRLFKEIRQCTDLNVDFLIIGYPGYVCDSSSPSEENFYKYSDCIAQYFSSAQSLKCIKSAQSGEYNKIHFLAFSIGCAMAVDCATKIKKNMIDSLTLMNPFTNIKSCAKHIIENKIQFLKPIADKVLANFDYNFDNFSLIKKVKIKNLNIIFSSNDSVSNNKNSLNLFKNAINCKNKNLYEVCGDHCDWIKYDIINLLLGIKGNNKLLMQKISANYENKKK